jgi:penicillin-insensitive murein DD-endopeptidase
MKAARLALCLAACAGSGGPSQEAAPRPRPADALDAAGPDAPAPATAGAVDAGSVQPQSPGPLAALPAGSFSTSIGSATNGRVLGSVALPLHGPGFRFNSRRDSAARYGTVEVIGSIERAADVVRARFPESELVVNDIGLAEGGPISHHGSHRAGRDADILFYLRGDDGAPTPSVGAPIDPQGIGFDFKELSQPDDDVRVHFDAERTWHFVAALLEDPEARVQRIFVVEHLRSALLAAARRVSGQPETIARFEDVTCQPSYPHDDHLHVRWFCSLEDLTHGCQDLPPLYPWREAELKAAGVRPVLATRTKSTDPAPITTQAEATREVKRQRPHKAVMAFLAQRKAWEKQPHPGRPFCP